MIHDPCGILITNFPCMVDGKCSKRFPKQLIVENISKNDGYPLYRQRSTDDNGRSTIVKMNQLAIEVNNHWLIPFSSVTLKNI